MISTFCNTHPPQKCHVNVIRDTVMQHKRNRLRRGIDVRNRVSVVRITFHGNIWEKSSFSYGLLNVVLRFSFLVVSSNFVKWIQNSCHWIRFHTLPFVISNRVSFGGYVRCICIEDFAMDQTAFVSAPWNSPFFLSFWSSFLLCLLFRQNSVLAKKLAFNELLVCYSHRCFLKYKFLDRYFSRIFRKHLD